MNRKKLSNFLVRAKLNTYATNGGKTEKNINDGSKELTFEEGEFKYKDHYFGHNPFLGEEIVWKDNNIIWGMNYYGQVIDKKVPSEKIYEFLREALKTVGEDRPFRGKDKYEMGFLKYINKVDGNIDNFKGLEQIFYNDKLIYTLLYFGGVIKNKK